MRRIDTLAATAGLIACLAIARPYEPPSPALEADAWLIEREVEVAFTELSGSFEACYAATLPRAGEPDGRAGMALAATCYGDAAILLA